MLEFAAAVGQFEQALAPVLRPAVLDDETAPQQLSQNSVEALLGDAQDAEQLADRDLRVAADKMHDPVMRPPEPVFGQDRIRLGGEVAIGEEQQFDPLPDFLVAEERRVGRAGWLIRRLGQGVCRNAFYVSHIDISGNHRYKPGVLCGISSPDQAPGLGPTSPPRPRFPAQGGTPWLRQLFPSTIAMASSGMTAASFRGAKPNCTF